jgi:hypothetical protein
MTIDVEDALTRLLDHAKAIGSFEVARLTEFKQAPPPSLCFALWVEDLGSAPDGSGLASTNALLHCTARIYFPMLHRPESAIEPKVFGAAALYLGRINGDFTLGGTVRNVDILGEQGDLPRWRGGYANIDNKLSRIADLNINVIFNDGWEQRAVTA